MEIRVSATGLLGWRGRRCRCALGDSGLSGDKREGDGATPRGSFALRRVLYRPDRLEVPATDLPLAPLRRHDGWCDEPWDRNYNRQVTLPYPASCEALWRQDRLYDLIVVLGHNDEPVVPGRGSAIFLHLARPDYAATAGCVAVARTDLLAMLREVGAGGWLRIGAPV